MLLQTTKILCDNWNFFSDRVDDDDDDFAQNTAMLGPDEDSEENNKKCPIEPLPDPNTWHLISD